MKNNFWDDKRVLVTGGAGFVGSHLVEELLRRSPRARVTIVDNLTNGRKENLKPVLNRIQFQALDLMEFKNCLKACKGQEVVLNLAAVVGGIDYNLRHPGTMFRRNILLSSHMLEAARCAGVKRFLVVSSACVYSRFCSIPTPESEGFTGWPEDTNEGYGWAKRMAEFQASAYHKEFGMQIAIVRPYNTYGPRDHFDPETSHVIPALIRRIWDGENPLRVWGDGNQSRAFLYVEDLARGMLDATEKYAVCDPVNLGTSEEVRIADLARLILKLSGKKARIHFDASKPSGQPRRNCDVSKAREKTGFVARTSLGDGLRRTLQWYVKSHRS